MELNQNLYEQTTIPVSRLLQRKILSCDENTRLMQAIRLMNEKRCSSIIVLRGGSPAGIWTERDALKFISSSIDAHAAMVGDVMSQPVRTIHENTSTTEAHSIMLAESIRHLVAVDSTGQATGILTLTDLIRSHGVELYIQLREVQTALNKKVFILEGSTPLSEASNQMYLGRVSAVAVGMKGGYGVLTERDVIRAIASDASDLPIEQFASFPMKTVRSEDSLLLARQVMMEHGLRRVGVVNDQDQFLGFVGFEELLSSSQVEIIQNLEKVIHDLETEKRKLKDDLESATSEKEGIYEKMFTQNVAPKLLIDPSDGAIIDANPAALSFYGYTSEEIRSVNIKEINILTEEEVRREMNLARAEERQYFEFRHRVKDGSIKDVKVYSGPINMGDRTLLHSIIHDVTKSRAYERELMEYKKIFEELPVGVFRNTPGKHGKFLMVNSAMVRIFEAESEAKLLDHSVASLYEDPSLREEFSAKMLEEGFVKNHSLQLRTLKGKKISVRISAYRNRLEDGSVVFNGVIEDLTEQIALERNRDLLLEIIEASPDLILMANKEREVTFINRGGLRMLGLMEDQNRSFSIAQVQNDESQAIHPPWAQRKILEEGIPHARKNGYWRGDSAIVTARGEEIPVSQVIVAHYNKNGNVERYSTISRDISERVRILREVEKLNQGLEKRVQEELQKRQAQERLLVHNSRMAALGEMIGSIVHQWKQPLSVLMLNIQDLLDANEYNELNDEYIKRFYDESLMQIEYMSSTVEDFRSFFRQEREKSEFDCSIAVRKAVELVESFYSRHRISIEVVDRLSKDSLVYGRKNEFQQAILILLNNAKDALASLEDSEKNEQANEQAQEKRITIQLMEKRGYVYIKIEDNGGGIPEEHRAHIFEPYFTTKGSSGTGIGLNMAKTIIQSTMDGDIHFENTIDGASFSIVVPKMR